MAIAGSHRALRYRPRSSRYWRPGRRRQGTISAWWTPPAVPWWRGRQVRPGAQAHRRGRRAGAPGGSLDPLPL